jgi:hypothetical protein
MLAGGRDQPRYADLYLLGEIPNQLGESRQTIR